MESWRKLLCLFLAMVMCLSLMPLPAFAAEEEDGQNPEEELADVLNEDPAEEGQENETCDGSGDVTDEPTDSGEGDQTGEPGNEPGNSPADEPTDNPEDELAEEPQEDTVENEDEENVEIASIVDSGSCGLDGDNLAWTLDDEGNLVISGTGEMADYDNAEQPWDIGIKTIEIESGVTSIGAFAFKDCVQLTDATLANTVTEIGDWAFDNCESLAHITIPESVTTFGSATFYGCDSLETAGPSGIENGYNYQFGWTEAVPAQAFESCESLISVTLPDGMTSVGDWAFSYCENLIQFNAPESLTQFGEGAFEHCVGLADDKGFIIINTKLVWYAGGSGDAVIPDTVTCICSKAFSGEAKIANVVIPLSVTVIEEDAFLYQFGMNVYYEGTEEQWEAIQNDGLIGVEPLPIESYVPSDPGSGEADGIAVSEANFPDLIFRDYVAGNYDTDQNGILSEEELAAVIDMDVSCELGPGIVPIRSLKGVELFPSLEVLNCSGNALKTLNVSECSNLHVLNCSDNILSGLTINENLAELDCSNNRLSTLSFRALEGLERLYCNGNNLQELDLGTKENLCILACQNNAIEVLDISGCPKLKALVADNSLTDFDGYSGYISDSGMEESILTFDSYVTLALYYPMSGACGESVYWVLNLSGVLTIYGTGDMTDYSDEDMTPWVLACFDGSDYHSEIIYDICIEEGVTGIGNGAFRGLTGLCYAEIPASINRIGSHAFQNCENIVALSFSGNAPVISPNAFEGAFGSAFYPADDATWTTEVLQNYEGEINWVQREAWTEADDEPDEPENSITAVEIYLLGEESDSDVESEYVDGQTYIINRNSKEYGESITLVATVYSTMEDCPVLWTVSDKKNDYAEYQIDGEYLYVQPGRSTKNGLVTIKATAQDGSKKSATIILKFTALSKGIEIEEPATRKIVAGQKLQLKAAILGAPVDKTILWSVSGADSAYISVSASGLVTAKKAIRNRTVTVRADARDEGCSGKEIELQYVPLTEAISICQGEEYVTDKNLMVDLNAEEVGTLTFNAEGNPSGAEPKVTWKLAGAKNVAILSDNEDGSATLIPAGSGKTGTVTLSAAAGDGSKKTAKLTVTYGRYAQSVEILNAPEAMTAGNSVTLKTSIDDDKTLTDRTVLWHLSDEDMAYAYIDEKGTLTVMALDEPLELTVWAEVKANGKLSEQKTIQLLPLAESVELYKDGVFLEGDLLGLDLSDDNFVLTGKILPEGAAQNGEWISSNTKIATVDENGKVTPHKEGNVTITYTTLDGSKKSEEVSLYVGTLITDIEIICNQTGAEIETAQVDIQSAGGTGTGMSLQSGTETYVIRSGGKLQLKAKTVPVVSNALLDWSIVRGGEYATVNSKGLVTAKKDIREKNYVEVVAKTKYLSIVQSRFVIAVKPENDHVIRLFLDNDGTTENITGVVKTVSRGNTENLVVKNAAGSIIQAHTITWKSSDPKVVTVSKDGVLTGLKAGKTAKITASYKVGKKTYSASCTVKVVEVPATGLTVSAEGSFGANVLAGQTLQLKAEATNANASKPTIIWKLEKEVKGVSINAKTGAVSASNKKDNKIKTVKTVKVIATVEGTKVFSEPFEVKVWPAASGVKVSAPGGATYDKKNNLYKYSLKKGQQPELTLRATVTPAGKTLQGVSWISSNKEIATIDDTSGKITILKNGKVEFTAKSLDGKISPKIKITFVGWPSSISIAEQSGKAMTVTSGKSITLKATVNGENSIAPENGKVTWSIGAKSLWNEQLQKEIQNYVSITYPGSGKKKDETKGVVTVRGFGSDDVKRIKELMQKYTSDGISIEADGSIKVQIIATAQKDTTVRNAVMLTIVPMSKNKELLEWQAYNAYRTNEKNIALQKKNLSINQQTYSVTKIPYTDLEGNPQTIYVYDTGICTFDAYVNLLNRFIFYHYGVDQSKIRTTESVLKEVNKFSEKFMFYRSKSTSTTPRNITGTSVYLNYNKDKIGDAINKGKEIKEVRATNSNNKQKYDPLVRANGDKNNYNIKNGFCVKDGYHNFGKNSKPYPYIYDGKKIIVKHDPEFPGKVGDNLPGLGKLTPEKLAKLLREHPEGVWIYGLYHAVVVVDYEYLGEGEYRFKVADPVPSAGYLWFPESKDKGISDSSGKIMKTQGLKLKDIHKVFWLEEG